MDIRQSRSWMYNRLMPGRRGLTDEFLKGVDEFVSFAIQRDTSNKEIRCPCSKCKNMKFLDPEEVKVHIYSRGFKPDYWYWTCHGESHPELCVEFTTQHKKKPTQERQNNHNQIHCDQKFHDVLHAVQKPLSLGIKKKRKNGRRMKSTTVARRLYYHDSCSSSTKWVQRHELEEFRNEIKQQRHEVEVFRNEIKQLRETLAKQR
ncbi:unnamed protein product [Trifolium pratense]|uniref:Uncharacterized protein n=1 Tax=Trifolium pratense TaxID=57577 RepID=A0ACB0JSZ5_TRIPR|nr:unnamed protein product [Trifolium pratense]